MFSRAALAPATRIKAHRCFDPRRPDVVEKSSTDERRGAYRVHPETPDELELEILSQRQRLVRAVIDDVAVGGARVHLDKVTGAELADGERVNLALASNRFSYASDVPARVVSMSDSDTHTTLHLSFDSQPAAAEAHGGEVFALFNRRTTPRGPALAGGPDFHARVSSNEVNSHMLRTYTVDVRNISNVGVSLNVNARVNEELHAQSELLLSLQLPGRSERSRVACHVRHRHVDGTDFIYSCEYDWSATNDALGVIEDLVDYVLERGEAASAR